MDAVNDDESRIKPGPQILCNRARGRLAGDTFDPGGGQTHEPVRFRVEVSSFFSNVCNTSVTMTDALSRHRA